MKNPRIVIFWMVFVPAAVIALVLNISMWPFQFYRGCVCVYMELLERFEHWCFRRRRLQDKTLKQAFDEGFLT